MIGPWRIGRTIGKGSSGRVKIAKHSKTGQYAAVKIVPKHALVSSRMSINEAGAKVGGRELLKLDIRLNDPTGLFGSPRLVAQKGNKPNARLTNPLSPPPSRPTKPS